MSVVTINEIQALNDMRPILFVLIILFILAWIFFKAITSNNQI